MVSFVYVSKLTELHGLQVKVNYELYDGIPLICKGLSIKNSSNNSFKINTVVNEILAIVEEESAVVGSPEKMKKPQGIYFESNFAVNNAMRYDLSDQTLHWKTDPSYAWQGNYDY